MLVVSFLRQRSLTLLQVAAQQIARFTDAPIKLCARSGVRKEVRIGDQSVLLLWYKNEIYAIETR